ncbi:Histone-lysine N-methyltransferase SETDB2 [Acipenser ruthenus]|uniref:Histone-lysine N-methyltransferase SETDB2 n=1 Tax=Acipenser ruthenus TaxID=7906 RepID=A0A444UP29_ACIRT|nr:Histone-lysine N-methyltransferase SETDB2 [Acipenser ruthenus]
MGASAIALVGVHFLIFIASTEHIGSDLELTGLDADVPVHVKGDSLTVPSQDQEFECTEKTQVDKAVRFWNNLIHNANVDFAFKKLYAFLNALNQCIKDGSATDQENAVSKTEADKEITAENAVPNETTEEPMLEEGLVGVKDNQPSGKVTTPSEDLKAPSFPSGVSFQPHACSRTCLPVRPETAEQFRGQNPLNIPLLCHFQRAHAKADWRSFQNMSLNVFYKAPCGRSLRDFQELCQYVLETECDFLSLEYFSFNTYVQVYRSPALTQPLAFEQDLSRGEELVAVEFRNDVDETKPDTFRTKCACLKLTAKANALKRNKRKRSVPPPYKYKRLMKPVPSGIYECSAWCKCDLKLCQNRVVQHGLRVRLQVFKTEETGWGVRCLDDIDEGTFVCTYAGKILIEGTEDGFKTNGAELEAGHGDADPAGEATKRKREAASSDEDIEKRYYGDKLWKYVATRLCDKETPKQDGNAPGRAGKAEGGGLVTEAVADPDVVQQVVELAASGQNVTNHSVHARKEDLKLTRVWSLAEERSETKLEESAAGHQKSIAHEPEYHYYLDATQEGNVARFLNHSCYPNLFVQNVFVDSHNRNFPLVTFFTNRHVKSGTELTWNYKYKAGSTPEKEIECQCEKETCKAKLL